VPAADEVAADAELARVLLNPEWRAFAEFVLESAVLGLVQESAAGDWELPDEAA
jgi:hypothetical protein